MSAQPIAYGDVDHEAALKYAVQLIDHRWAQVIEGRIVLVSPMWDHERIAARIRRRVVQEAVASTGTGLATGTHGTCSCAIVEAGGGQRSRSSTITRQWVAG